tara:strand:+ start:455 stop:643 length:189 start_codon:yes stop_codon:yes gene_type:complete
MKSKWHNITIRTQTFRDLKGIQKLLPIRASIPDVIEWLLKVGTAQIMRDKVEKLNENEELRN